MSSLQRSIARKAARGVMSKAGCRKVAKPYYRGQEYSGKRSFFAENWRKAVCKGL